MYLHSNKNFHYLKSTFLHCVFEHPERYYQEFLTPWKTDNGDVPGRRGQRKASWESPDIADGNANPTPFLSHS